MKILVASLMIIGIVLSAQAQYNTYKNKYDAKEYKYQATDRYNLGAATLLSVIPGLGHCYIGEPARGFGFFALTYSSIFLTGMGIAEAWKSGQSNKAGWMVGGGTLLFVGSYIWSFTNVRKVAKIKNMVLRDENVTMQLYPSLQAFVPENARGSNMPGVTLTVNF